MNGKVSFRGLLFCILNFGIAGKKRILLSSFLLICGVLPCPTHGYNKFVKLFLFTILEKQAL